MSSSTPTLIDGNTALPNLKIDALALDPGAAYAAPSTCSKKPSHLSGEETDVKREEQEGEGMHVKIAQKAKWGLLFIFSLALFVDQWCLAAFYIFTAPIIEDLGVPFSQQSWIITSYAVTFAASLLFWGRMSDLYSAKQVFAYGFMTLGALCFVISFLPEKYSFFILRALSGIAGGTSVPSAFRLIVGIFEPHELKKAFTLYGMAGATAATTGNIVAGLLQIITRHDQLAGWRWFFRLMAVMIIPVSVGSMKWIPKVHGSQAGVKDKWKRLDLVGSLTMLTAIVCLILALTLGATSGWGSAGFIAPLIISSLLFPAFFIHEARLPTTHALLPPSTWRYQNFTLWIVFALLVQGWFAVMFLPLIEIFVSVRGESSLMAAVRTLPTPIAAVLVTIAAARFPQMTTRPRVTVTICLALAIGAYVMFIESGEQVGMDYWKFLFSPLFFGGAAMMAVFNMINVGVTISVPPEMAGVAGALLQVSVQVGNALALAIQSGLLTVYPGGIYNFDNVKVSWYFELGWTGVWLVGFLVFYRNSRKETGDDERGREVVVAH